MLTGATNPTL
jgi:hypothetical protein